MFPSVLRDLPDCCTGGAVVILPALSNPGRAVKSGAALSEARPRDLKTLFSGFNSSREWE
jgi:hypothetical protein